MLLHAEEAEIHGSFGVLHRGIPFVGPNHGHGDRITCFDPDMQVATTGGGMVDATDMKAGGLHGDSLAIGRSPVENVILSARERGEGAE